MTSRCRLLPSLDGKRIGCLVWEDSIMCGELLRMLSVRIRNSGYGRARIAEFRGLLCPNGSRVYRVRFRKKPASYTEVLEEQLEVLPPLRGEG